MKIKLLILFTLFFSFSVFAETLKVETITEALAYTGDKEAITKLVVTGTIAGNDYSEGSEWREFRTLDETFPNIEAVEILTSQDIPDATSIKIDENYQKGYGLFNKQEFINNQLIRYPLYWLKKFSAINTKRIGNFAFDECVSLVEINFTSAETIGIAAFGGCESLMSICFPNVKNIDNTAFAECDALNDITFPVLISTSWGVFNNCKSLVFASFGTGFTEPTEIKFGIAVFGAEGNDLLEPILTPNIELTLGENVLPKPDTIFNTWQNTNYYENNTPYIWKRINITVGINEEIIESQIYYLGNNYYCIKNAYICNLELYDLVGRNIKSFSNERIIDLNDLAKGVYFLRYSLNNIIQTEKLIRH